MSLMFVFFFFFFFNDTATTEIYTLSLHDALPISNLVRAGTDSTYYLDEGLRLWGTSAIGAGTPGMDMNYNHKVEPGGPCGVTCGRGSGQIPPRMGFAGSPAPSHLPVYTYFLHQHPK